MVLNCLSNSTLCHYIEMVAQSAAGSNDAGKIASLDSAELTTWGTVSTQNLAQLSVHKLVPSQADDTCVIRETKTAGVAAFESYTASSWNHVILNNLVGVSSSCGAALNTAYTDGVVTLQPGEYIVRAIKHTFRSNQFAIRLSEVDSSGNHVSYAAMGSAGWNRNSRDTHAHTMFQA